MPQKNITAATHSGVKNGVFEPFCESRCPSVAKKERQKAPFLHTPPRFVHSILLILPFFFTSRRTLFRKKSTPNFSAALTFLDRRPPNFPISSEKRCEPITYKHPSKWAFFRPRALFFKTPPVFRGLNRPIFRKLAQKCLQFESSFMGPSCTLLVAIIIYCCPIKVRSSIDSIKIGGQT